MDLVMGVSKADMLKRCEGSISPGEKRLAEPERGVLVGVRSIRNRPGELMDLAERMDLVTLLVTGRWLGVGCVGVLKGPALEEALGGGVEGRGGVPNMSA